MPIAAPLIMSARGLARTDALFCDFQPARDKIRLLRAKRLFMRKHPDDPLVRLVSHAAQQEYLDSVVRAVRDQEKRKLEGGGPYRWLRRLAAWIGKRRGAR